MQDVWNKIEPLLRLRRNRGLGDIYRRCSQYLLLKRWEQQYGFSSAAEAPYDEATGGIDGLILECSYRAVKNISDLEPKSVDFIWNFGFIQRHPYLIFKMKKVSRKYVAVFTPNCLNPGMLIHRFYHLIHRNECNHPERGDKRLMKINGLIKLFESAKLKILEYGYMDIPPWFDTVVTVRQLFSVNSDWAPLEIKVDVKPLIVFESVLKPKSIFAHHCYILGQV